MSNQDIPKDASVSESFRSSHIFASVGGVMGALVLILAVALIIRWKRKSQTHVVLEPQLIPRKVNDPTLGVPSLVSTGRTTSLEKMGFSSYIDDDTQSFLSSISESTASDDS